MFRLASIIFGSSRYEQNKVAAISWERTESVSRVAWNLGDDPWWTLGGCADAFGAGVGVALEGGDELGHLLVALDAAE